jgi:hypothetical protein
MDLYALLAAERTAFGVPTTREGAKRALLAYFFSAVFCARDTFILDQFTAKHCKP